MKFQHFTMPSPLEFICSEDVSSLGLRRGCDANTGTSLKLFTRLVLVTTLSFVILFAPFLPPFSPMSTLAASISRIFPSSRGLFEDKVANFWCFTSIAVLKWRRLFDEKESLLVKGSGVLTALGFFPVVAGLLWGCYKSQSSPPADQQSQASILCTCFNLVVTPPARAATYFPFSTSSSVRPSLG
ncbi:hypothetical protein EV363DRAFT_1587434 [Boletus edulis]|nr:hypothetical protein EV363DRAFT_1587434 [Boletus edulis]